MSVKFYPNPAADKLTVEFEPTAIKNSVLQLYSENGIPVYQSRLDEFATSHTLSTIFLRPATYILRVINRDEALFESIIIISR